METEIFTIEIGKQEHEIVAIVNEIFRIPTTDIINQALSLFIRSKFKEESKKLVELQEKYKVKTSEEFDNLYREGTIPEEGTWEDFQDFDHYEYSVEQLGILLIALNRKGDKDESK